MAQHTIFARYRQKQDSSDEWQQNDLVLLAGEMGFEKTSDGRIRMKIGDGSRVYSELPYADDPAFEAIAILAADIQGKLNDKAELSHAHTAAEVGAAPVDAYGKVEPTCISSRYGMPLMGGSYTLTQYDGGALIITGSDPLNPDFTITIPKNDTVKLPNGTELEVMQGNSGTLTIVPAAGVTLKSLSGQRKIAGQNAIVKLKNIGANMWVLTGPLK